MIKDYIFLFNLPDKSVALLQKRHEAIEVDDSIFSIIPQSLQKMAEVLNGIMF